jgi:glycosyltransferase involved in cell wall biosynthesis
MKELKVALVSFYLGEYCVRLAGGIAQDPSVRLHLFLPRTQAEPYLHLLDSSVELHLFETPRIRQTYSHLTMLANLVAQIRAVAPDVVHFQHGHLTFNLLALPLLGRYPLVLTVHDASIHLGDGESRRTPQWVHDRACHKAQNTIVHAPQVKESLVGRLGLAPESVHVVPHVVIGQDATAIPEEAQQEEPQDGDPLILFFGRIWEYKGLEYLIRAEPLIAARVPRAKIVIAGTGEDFDRYTRMMQNPDHFILHNEYVSDEKRAALFRQASVVVLPYVEASQSGVIPIAYSFQKPVVATTVGGLPEMVDHGETGYLVPPRDPQALADAIVPLLENEQLRKRLGLNGAQKIYSECSPEIVGEQTRHVYRKALLQFWGTDIFSVASGTT